MANSEEMVTIKQERLDDDIQSEDSLSIDNSFEDATSIKKEIDDCDIKRENINVHLVCQDIKFVKCEGEISFDWKENEVDPLLIQDEDMAIKKELSPDIKVEINDSKKDIPIDKYKTNTLQLNSPEETCQNKPNDKDNESISYGREESTFNLNSDGYYTGSAWLNGERIDTYNCGQCHFIGNTTSTIFKHLRTHSGERPHKCSHCNYAAVHTNNLATHLSKHTGEKPHKCSQCNYASAYKNNVASHMEKHSNEKKPYKCSHCSYASVYKNYLVSHMKKHSNEMPYKCSQCSYASFHKNNLVSHMKKHSNEKPHKCSQCKFASVYKTNVVRHMKTHSKAGH